MVDAKTISLVQDSWSKVVPIADKVPEIFYPKLFEIDPSTKPLFKTDITTQGSKLIAALSKAVQGLDELDKLIPVLDSLGRRHANYGVKDEMFASVGEALIYTLGAGLGDAFTPEVKQAWVDVYAVICSVMQPAMADEIQKQQQMADDIQKEVEKTKSSGKKPWKLVVPIAALVLGTHLAKT